MKKTFKLMSCVLMSLCIALNAKAFTTTESETLKVWYELPTFIADGKTVNYIKVYENDGDNEYSAFNMHFILPEGLQINKIKQGRELVNDITLSDRASSTHAISCNMPDATTLKVICTSSMNDNLYNTDLDDQPLDYLFEVGLIADPELAPGKYEIYLDGIKFVFKNADASVPANEPIPATMVVESGTSGIGMIADDNANIEDCYDIMGRKVNPVDKHGIIISNGTKLLVK